MKLLTIKEAATATGLKECELRLGAKQGRYPYIRSGRGGRNAPYFFELGLLEKAIEEQAQQNMLEAKKAFEETIANMPTQQKRYVPGTPYRYTERERPLRPDEIEKRKMLYIAE
ncbi:hypothetical protein [Anaerotignum faecicola]|jgi:hypothetical protein